MKSTELRYTGSIHADLKAVPDDLDALYREIAGDDQRRLNWRAMNYFVGRGEFTEAAQCRERVVAWNSTGPV